MDHKRYTVRPFADSDYEEVARLNKVIDPKFPETAEDSRRWDRMIRAQPDRLMLKMVVREAKTGSMVAWGGLAHTLWNYRPDRYYIRVVVHPDQRSRGIGQEVYSLLEGEAVRRGGASLWSNARETEPHSVRFLERQGFVPVRKTWLSRLDLSRVDLSSFPDRSAALSDRGIQFTTLDAEGADRPEVRQRLFELSRITSRDVPRIGEYTPISFEEFVVVDLVGPRVLADAIFVARKGEEYIGWSSLQRMLELPDTLDIGFTGTLPEFRGSGIASELKRRAVMYARDHGYRFVITANDSLNPRIWAINEKLGFRKEDTLVQAEKTLPALR